MASQTTQPETVLVFSRLLVKSGKALFLFLWLSSPLLCAGATEADEILFVRRILPLLNGSCIPCHGGDETKIKGGLDLRSLESVIKGGKSGKPSLVPARPGESGIYLAATRNHQDWDPMPPKEADRIPQEQLVWLERWISAGAPWPGEGKIRAIREAGEVSWSAEDGVPVKTSGGLSPEWSGRKYKPEGLWAYQPVKRPVPPANAASGIDAFIEARMPSGLRPAPAADARTLIRRAAFDLTGLPPAPEEVEDFVKAFARNSETAMAGLIERLLGSPHYGERMAQHWLDVTRYADSSGFSNDFERGNAWRYRDYVIRSFNNDKPYDQFVREQIAGDELDPANPEMIVATGFLRMGPWELTSMEVAKIARQRFLDDVVNSVGETFLAQSLQCARCHDHKFDPIPTRDYYSVQAVFATTQLAERPAAFLDLECRAGFEERQFLELRKAEHLATLRKLDEKSLAAVPGWFESRKLDPSRWNEALAGLRDTSRGRFNAARNALLRQGHPEDSFPPRMLGWTSAEIGLERIASKGLERLQWEFDRYEPVALSVYNGRTPAVTSISTPFRMPPNRMNAGELEETSILTVGDPFSTGPRVKPGVLSLLAGSEKVFIPDTIEGRRRAFAEWVADAQNPLTTRAIVNRVWMWHFGRPIAGNPNNFGSTGKKPTHPELLDWLASTFVDHGWSFKALHRVIMTSQAYRRGHVHPDPKTLRALDPPGESHAVFSGRRLSAEELRDAMLAASGELNRALGGIPNRPEISLEAALQPRQVMGTFADAWTPNPRPEQRNRRSLYALKLRGLRDPMLEVFNSPAPDFSCERRESSTVTPQVFSLFNSQASQARSLALAARVLRESNTDSDAIQRLFLILFARPPRSEELRRCLDHWHAGIPMVTQAPPRPVVSLEVKREAVEENTGEKFIFGEKLHALAGYEPDLHPADVDARTRALADVCLVLFNSNEFDYVD